MVLELLKEQSARKMPIYLGSKQIEVVEIYDEFGLIDIKHLQDSVVFAVDVTVLSSEPYFENSICLSSLFW